MATHLDWKKVHSWLEQERHIFFIDTMNEFDSHTVKEACHNEFTHLIRLNTFEQIHAFLNNVSGNLVEEQVAHVAIAISDADQIVPMRFIANAETKSETATDEELYELQYKLNESLIALEDRGVPTAVGYSYKHPMLIKCRDGILHFARQTYDQCESVHEFIDSNTEWMAENSMRDVADEIEGVYNA